MEAGAEAGARDRGNGEGRPGDKTGKGHGAVGQRVGGRALGREGRAAPVGLHGRHFPEEGQGQAGG